MTATTRSRPAVLDRIAELIGGWAYDWDRGFDAYRRRVDGAEDPNVAGRALVFVHRSHALQTAMAAEAESVPEPLVVAALLHDIGHGLAPPAPPGREADYDDRHEVVGAMWLREAFVPMVSEPVLHHVAAKRYLVATRPDYRSMLAPDSVLSLDRQGGGLSPTEIEVCRALPYFQEGVQLRIWDDLAKDWSRRTRDLDHYRPFLDASWRD